MNLKKRICSINMELTPEGCGVVRIDLIINEDHYVMNPTSAVGSQFFSFVHSLYTLYSEANDDHIYKGQAGWRYKEKTNLIKDEHGNAVSISTSFGLFDEGPCHGITLTRQLKENNKSYYYAPTYPDFITVEIKSTRYKTATYTIDAKDICYAVAKAYTNVIKKYGILGYGASSSCMHSSDRDDINLNEFLFIKAYALDALNVRELQEVSRYYYSSHPNDYSVIAGSSFEDELELLLFDM